MDAAVIPVLQFPSFKDATGLPDVWLIDATQQALLYAPAAVTNDLAGDDAVALKGWLGGFAVDKQDCRYAEAKRASDGCGCGCEGASTGSTGSLGPDGKSLVSPGVTGD